MNQRVIITGNLGYIGTIITEEMLKSDYEIIGIDTNYYNGQKFIDFEFSEGLTQLKKDIRDVEIDDLKGVNSIIHLAALSNDPIGQLNPELTNEINYVSSLRLAELAKKAGVSRFLFSSSCSIYGQTQDIQLTEESPLNPVTHYATSKVKLEESLSEMANDNFSPVFLRNATAYGVSPNMRFDLVTNNLTGWGYTTKQIKILSDGRAWRPIVHIRDISKAFIAVLDAPKDIIHNQAFNVGINSENYQVKDIAEEIHKKMKDCEVQILGKGNPDQRNYNVNFDKITTHIKDYKPEWNLQKGVEELIETFNKVNFNTEQFQDKNFTRIKQLQHLLDSGLINERLIWN